MAASPDENRRFFVSHAGADKSFATALRDELDGRAWVDLFEIPLGAIIIDEVAAGIEGSTDFVLLWSAASATSRWVQFEFNMAFVRHLEDDAIAIRIICLDDTETPLKYRPFLQARGAPSPAQAAELLLAEAPQVPTLRPFVNRSDEIGYFDSSLYSSDRGLLWYCGLPGVGKRAVVRESARRAVANPGRVRTVEVREGTSFVELDLLLSATLGAEPSPDSFTESQARDAVVERIGEFADSGGIWVFEEVQHWLTDESRPGPVLTAVLGSLERAHIADAARLAIFTSTRRPQLNGSSASVSDIHMVRGLSEDFGAALLRSHGADAEEQLIRRTAVELDGHPLSLEIVATQLGADEPDWEDYRAHAATGMVGSLRLDDAVIGVLERVSIVDGPLAAQDYADHLGLSAEAFQDAVAIANSLSLIEESDQGYLRLHPLVRDFFSRLFRKHPAFLELVGDLADRSKTVLLSAIPGTALYVDSVVTTFKLLAWAMRLDEAIEIRRNLYGTLFETAIELYRQKEYAIALRYFEIVIDSVDDTLEAKLYLARTLAYLHRARDARRMIAGVTDEHPDDAYAWYVRGRVEYILRDFPAAIGFYEKSLELRANHATALRDLGQARIRVGDWYGARAALERGLSLRSRDPDAYLAFHYANVLEHFREFDEASRLMGQAIRRDPRNPIFHHRLGRIAQQQGHRDVAVNEFREALRLDPTFVDPALSLANLAVDGGDLAEARRLLTQVRGKPNARQAVVFTIEATIDLAAKDFAAARFSIEQALAAERDLQSLSIAARIELEALEDRASVCSDVSGAVRSYAEEIRLAGSSDEAERILLQLAAVCP